MVIVLIVGQLFYYTIFVSSIFVVAGIIVYLSFFYKGLKREDIDLMKKFLPVRLSPLLIRPVYFFGGTKLKRELV